MRDLQQQFINGPIKPVFLRGVHQGGGRLTTHETIQSGLVTAKCLNYQFGLVNCFFLFAHKGWTKRYTVLTVKATLP